STPRTRRPTAHRRRLRAATSTSGSSGISGREVAGGGEGPADGGVDGLDAEAAPEHVPLGEPAQAVALLGVPGGDGVGGARAPEEARKVAGDQRPQLGAEPFALGRALDG